MSISAFGAAAMVAESNGATETAAWLPEQGQAVAELVAAGNFLASNPIGMVTDGAVRRWERAKGALIGGSP